MTDDEQQSDGQLLAAFAETGDEAAFAAIVRRHGAMVQGTCLRVLGDFHEAQDVTQAVFLTLASKAARLRKDPSVGGWLHHVATCLARNARSAAQSRKRREGESMQTTTSVAPTAADVRALRGLVGTGTLVSTPRPLAWPGGVRTVTSVANISQVGLHLMVSDPGRN